MKKIIAILLTAFCLSGLQLLYATEIIAPHITGLVESDGSGLYQQVLKEAARRAGVTFSETVYPVKRALKALEKEEGDCIYSYTDQAEAMFGSDNIVTSFPMSVFKLYMFTRKGEAPPVSVESLKGKRVSGVIGHEGFYNALQGIRIDFADNDHQNLKLLQNNRVDVILGFLPDLTPMLDQLSYSPKHPLYVGYDGITCRKNEAGRKFVETISPAIEEMKKDGTLRKMMGDIYVEFEFPPTEK